MIDEVPPFNSLTDKEIQATEALLGGPHKHTMNGHPIDVERGLLKKTVIKNLEEHIPKEPSFGYFQMFHIIR